MKCPVEVTPNHVVYDRSRVVTDWDCPRKRWLGYEFANTGLSPEMVAMELYTGTTLHDAKAAIATFHKRDGKVDIDLIAETARQQMYDALNPEHINVEEVVNYANEQSALIEGLIRGFYKHAWPKLMADHDIVAIEEELFFIHNDKGESDLKGKFIQMSKPDLILSGEEGWIYIEYKSTSSKKDTWISAWDTAVQVHSTMAAVEQSLGTEVHHTVVQGLYKGYESYGKQSSPFCYAYHRQGNPPFTKAETVYEYKQGYRRIPTWDLDGGVKGWVESMPEIVLANQFPATPPIFANKELITAYFAQRASRELEIKIGKKLLNDGAPEEVVLNNSFSQRFDRCKPGYGNGKACGFRQICHGPKKDPLTSGFTPRVPHHELEVVQQEAQREATDATE